MYVACAEVDEVWRWGSRFVNLVCTISSSSSSSSSSGSSGSSTRGSSSSIGALLLLEYLRTGGHSAGKSFGVQFVKLMNLIKLYLLPSFSVLKETKPDSAAATAVVQLELLFDAFYKNNKTLPEPEGKQMKKKESEISQDV